MSCTGPKYQVVNGLKFSPCFNTDLADALTYEARPDDLFIVTYPKNGTTWTQIIVSLILHNDEMPEEYEKEGIWKLSPFLEANGKQAAIDAKRPCAIKTHLSYELHPKHPDAKFICVMRNAKDACVSFFYHHKMFKAYEIEGMDFHSFFPFWLKGEVECGDYFDFILSWWNQRDNPNILFLFYENMKSDPTGSVLTIAKFMGQEYADRVTANSNEILIKVVQKSSFNATKNHLNGLFLDNIGSETMTEDSPRQFARKGIVGDWENHLTPEESEIMDRVFHERLDGTGLDKMWDPYGIFA